MKIDYHLNHAWICKILYFIAYLLLDNYSVYPIIKEDFLSLNPKAGKIFDCIQTHFSQALLSIGNPEIPHTNNATERVIRRFNRHYKNMAGFESMATARAYLSLFAFFYRITPFYEAKDKQIRGLAPLQIAGVDITAIPAVKAFGVL